jgi:hypothetical protein
VTPTPEVPDIDELPQPAPVPKPYDPTQDLPF